MITSTLLSLLLPALVSAHGYVSQVTIDGTVYPGNSVGTSPTVKSAIRQVNTNGPVKGTSNPDINCGPGAQPAADVANANPGSNLLVQWSGGVSGGTQHWPHNVGAIMHYMAKCDGPCTTYDSSGAKWFKISELGQKPGGSTWYMSDIQSGSPANITIPNDLAAGNYLLRSELITLQLAMSQGGAEFYPSCIQLSVGGSQTGQPGASDEVTFPGAYKDNDPGILAPNVYNPGFIYPFPGPAVVNLASGGGTGAGSAGGSGASTAPTPSSASPSPSSPTGMSASSMPAPPANTGGNPPAAGTPSTPYPTSTGGSGSPTCMHKKKRSVPEPRIVVHEKRMHRRHNRSAH